MKRIVLGLVFFLVAGCTFFNKYIDKEVHVMGDVRISEQIQGMDFARALTPEERVATNEVVIAILKARAKGTICPGYSFPPPPIYLVRDVSWPIPELCAHGRCTTDYRDICRLIGKCDEHTLGYNGMAFDELILIKRAGSVLPISRYKPLLIHEVVHKLCNVHHGLNMKAYEANIKAELPPSVMRAAPIDREFDFDCPND